MLDRVRSAGTSTVLMLGAGVVVGFVMIAVAAVAVLLVDLVPLQVPWAISGGLGGLGLVGASLGLLTVHLDRVAAAEERRLLAELQREALRLQSITNGKDS